MRVAAAVRGRGPRLVLVHGFTQNARCWAPIDDDLAADHELVAVDLPGHGRSAELRLDVAGSAAAVGAAGGRAGYLGYSMGGRICLRLAVDRPDLVARLVLVGATAGLEGDERAARRVADEALAARIGQEGVAAFLDAWLSQPLFAGLPPASSHREQRLTGTADGWASSLRLAGTGAQEPLWHRLGELTMPVLVVAGARDAKFVALAERLAAGIGANATVALIPGAGHTAHLEQPRRFLDTLRAWLAGTGLAEPAGGPA